MDDRYDRCMKSYKFQQVDLVPIIFDCSLEITKGTSESPEIHVGFWMLFPHEFAPQHWEHAPTRDSSPQMTHIGRSLKVPAVVEIRKGRLGRPSWKFYIGMAPTSTSPV